MGTSAEEIIEYMCKKEISKREASTVNYLKYRKYEKTSQQPAVNHWRKQEVHRKAEDMGQPQRLTTGGTSHKL